MRWKLVPTGVAALAVILFAFAAAAQQQKPNILAGAHPLYRARTRAQPVAEKAKTGAARPTTNQNRRRARATDPAVVPTFAAPHQQSQTLTSSKVLESAKLG